MARRGNPSKWTEERAKVAVSIAVIRTRLASVNSGLCESQQGQLRTRLGRQVELYIHLGELIDSTPASVGMLAAANG